MHLVTAASPGIESGNLRKRIGLLRQAQEECTRSGVLFDTATPVWRELYIAHILDQIEWLTDELAVNDAQLELALFPALEA